MSNAYLHTNEVIEKKNEKSIIYLSIGLFILGINDIIASGFDHIKIFIKKESYANSKLKTIS